MPTPVTVGTEIKDIDLLEIFPPDEGEINQIYGRIGAGKTYCATVDILEDLDRGQVWYTNWKIDWPGYDERTKKWYLFLGWLGLKKEFLNFPKENLHYVDLGEKSVFVDGISTGKTFVQWISTLSDCKVALDEGHIAFDSYEMARMDLEKRNAVLWTRHFDRSYLVISQRPTAIHVTMRANVNRFFKCEKIMDFTLFWRWVRFQKTEFQDVDNTDRPDETKIKILDEQTHMLVDSDEYAHAVSQTRYWGVKKIFEKYNSKYRRAGLLSSQKNMAKVWTLTRKEAWKLLWGKA